MDFMAGGGARGVGPPDATKIIIITLAGRALMEMEFDIYDNFFKAISVGSTHLDSAAAKEDPYEWAKIAQGLPSYT